VPQDYCEAARWYRKAADQGYAEAQSYLGYMYVHAECVPQDYTEGVGWYRKAADQGHPRAESALGYAYSIGAGVPLDYVQSARWYRRAAGQGDDYARRALDAMNIRLSILSKIVLAVVFLSSMFVLIASKGSMRKGPHRSLTLGGFLGFLWVGLDVYGHSHFGILLSLSAVNVFFFGKSLVCGTSFAMIFSFLWARGLKVALGVFGALFIAFNIYATMHYGLRHFAACTRSFYSINALLIGAAITSAILLWTGKEGSGSQNGNSAVTPEDTPSTAAKPLGV
jgi:hypothetical protein